MKAAVFHGPDQPLEVTDVPTPSPGPGEALIRIAGCGMCHTDLHYLDHGVPTFKDPPIVLGHEPSGTIEGLGAGVEGWHEGDRVLIPAVLSCGRCRYCRAGRENLCDNLRMLELTRRSKTPMIGLCMGDIGTPTRILLRLSKERDPCHLPETRPWRKSAPSA